MALDKKAQINDPLLERLERLAARQGRASTTRALPPPDLRLERIPSTSPPFVDGPPALQPTHTAPKTATRTRRRHPARSARMYALLASSATTSGLVYFFAGTEASQASPTATGLVAPIAVTSPTSTAAASPSTVIDSATTTNPAAAPAAPATTATTAAANADAVAAFEGNTIQTRYGPVQVQAQVRNGTLVAVAVVQYPNGDGKSVRINQRALPRLQSEALAAQSAQVDTVSGATYTSEAYVRSLQSAIDEARAAGAVAA